MSNNNNKINDELSIPLFLLNFRHIFKLATFFYITININKNPFLLPHILSIFKNFLQNSALFCGLVLYKEEREREREYLGLLLLSREILRKKLGSVHAKFLRANIRA